MGTREASTNGVVVATDAHRPDLERLLARIEAEDHPEDPEAAARAPQELADSLARYDALSSDSVWFLIAYRAGHPAGLAVLSRVPKLDRRVGFLYVDELHILAEYRRRGIGRALMDAAIELARAQGLHGIRLLTRPEDGAARSFYEAVGGRPSETLLYQFPVVCSEPAS